MTTTYARRLAVVLAALPLVAGCGGTGHDGRDDARAAGGQPITGPGAHLVITTDNGVRLRPADGDRVVVDDRGVGHRWTHHDGTWVMDLSCARPPEADGPCPRMPEVDVPAGTSVTVTARNAGIDVAGIDAALDLTTVNGDVTVTGSGNGETAEGAEGAAVRLATRNGSVRADALRVTTLRAQTVNGDVVLHCATAPTGVAAATTNGSVRVVVPHDAPRYRVTATTDNGRPSVALPTDGTQDDRTMALTTVNGDVGAARE
ncbi:DUF4097 family beta strand repeat-containing protein [Streptomyces sp. NPDC017202]|uniref:DUF4097 family beta strand repeat-containing protein n=1 Tax=Streptomyces sp. NPDC017202 TaxID=3364981 RepID=UPI00378B8675